MRSPVSDETPSGPLEGDGDDGSTVRESCGAPWALYRKNGGDEVFGG